MNCHSTRAVLDLHAEGRLTERRSGAVAAHLSACAACRALAARPAAAASAAAPRSVKEKILQAAKTSRLTPAALPKAELKLWPDEAYGVAAAAAALLMVALAVSRVGAPDRPAVAASFLEVEP